MKRLLLAVVLTVVYLGIADLASARGHAEWIDLIYINHGRPTADGTSNTALYSEIVFGHQVFSEEEVSFLSWYYGVPPQEVGLLLPAIQKVR